MFPGLSLVFPTNTRRWANTALMLFHRSRRWPSTKPALTQRLVFARFVWTSPPTDSLLLPENRANMIHRYTWYINPHDISIQHWVTYCFKLQSTEISTIKACLHMRAVRINRAVKQKNARYFWFTHATESRSGVCKLFARGMWDLHGI